MESTKIEVITDRNLVLTEPYPWKKLKFLSHSLLLVKSASSEVFWRIQGVFFQIFKVWILILFVLCQRLEKAGTFQNHLLKSKNKTSAQVGVLKNRIILLKKQPKKETDKLYQSIVFKTIDPQEWRPVVPERWEIN